MRLPALLIALAACSRGTTPEIVPSERGPGMVHVPGDTVRLGRKLEPPVGPPPNGTPNPTVAPNQAPPHGAPNPPSQGGPQGPPLGPDGRPFPPPPGAAPTLPGGQPAPTLPGGQPSTPSQPSPPASPPSTGALLPVPSGPGEAPDLGLAPGAHRGANLRPTPDPLEPRDVLVGAFWIDVTEVTQAQYAEFLADTGYRPPYVDEEWAGDGWDWDGATPPVATRDHPVVLVSWWDARAYCGWAGKRLPTEAEWQLAVLGPADDERTFPWGDEYDAAKLNHGRMEVPNFDDSDGFERTSPVGSFPAGASRFGLQDAFGNAWEWTADIRVASWDDVLGERRGDVIVDPHTSMVGLYAAVRGGAYFFDLRPNPSGERNGFLMELRRKTSGFRCAKDD